MRLTCDAFKLSPVSLKVIPYGAEITRCDLPATLPDDMARLVEAKYALFLGRIHPKKNPELLLQAWSRGAPADWLLVIAGPAAPEYRQRLQTLARALGIESRVLFLEFTEGQRKAWLLEHARWFLLPSSQENFGVAVLEALLGGLPVVLSDQVAMAEELPSGSPVIEVAVECWANFFRVSMADEDYRERITAAQTRYAHEHFNITTLAAGWAATLRSIFA
jgi:glycosyltransferase involved in cell wall biosynthesis